jgi:hypothetical protein
MHGILRQALVCRPRIKAVFGFGKRLSANRKDQSEKGEPAENLQTFNKIICHFSGLRNHLREILNQTFGSLR